MAGTFVANGFGFGFLFAWAAGLASAFTACNCVVYAMIPRLTVATDATAARARHCGLSACSPWPSR